jgi:dipeptidase E
MKLLLTSGGITNKSIAKALFDLVGKKPEDTSLVFIPTASNVEIGDKSWFINDLMNLKKQNFKSIDITDISAVDQKIWKQKIEVADVIFFEGGDSYYLMEWISKSGLDVLLPEILKNKVYVGVSVGSMIVSKSLDLSSSQMIYEENLDRSHDLKGLNFVDFYFFPHLNSPHFPHVVKKNIENFAKKQPDKIYALDDSSALKIIDSSIEVVGEGEWLVFND